jgi:hypothetical protein
MELSKDHEYLLGGAVGAAVVVVVVVVVYLYFVFYYFPTCITRIKFDIKVFYKTI